MKNWKKWIRRILYPHGAVLLLLTAASAVLLTAAFAVFGGEGAFSYASFALSAYTLTALYFRFPDLVRLFRYTKGNNPYISRYFADPRLRVHISLACTLVLNLAYTVIQLILGIYHHTSWYYAMAGYYFLLGSIRFFLLRYLYRHKIAEDTLMQWRMYRLCAILLTVMNLSLTAIIFYIAIQGRQFRHHHITTIAMAAYTFTAFTLAIINVVRYRKYRSPVFSAAKVVSFVSAMVSMLTLESAMLTAFANGQPDPFLQYLPLITGVSITCTVLSISVRMMWISTKYIKEIKHAQQRI